MPVTATNFFGFFIKNLYVNSESSFLGFLLLIKVMFFLSNFIFFSEIIIFEPLLIASLI